MHTRPRGIRERDIVEHNLAPKPTRRALRAGQGGALSEQVDCLVNNGGDSHLRVGGCAQVRTGPALWGNLAYVLLVRRVPVRLLRCVVPP